jgi:hypothetical protein
MLPGFRFLFAATMLSMSLLIFGLGAAALLRAAHESFASNSSWRATPEVPFAQRPETMPVLATLRVEPNSFDRANEQVTAAPAPVDQPMPSVEPARVEPSRNDRVAALRPAETPPAEAAKPAEVPTPASASENPLATEAVSPAAASTEPVAAADERKVTLATSEATPFKSEPVVAPASQSQTDPAIATAETAPGAEVADSLAAMKIATLGGPPVDVTDDASIPLRAVKLPRARPDQAAIKKRVQARRALQRRRLALRARLMLQQQQANPLFPQQQAFLPAAAAAISR